MLKIKDLREGEMLSLTQYLTVESVNTIEKSITAVDRDGKRLVFRGEDLINSMNSASQYESTKKVGKHELANVLKNAGDKVFTVSFNKLNGDERILTGHYSSSETNLGRTNVIDLHVSPKDKTRGHRQIDNREINWIVCDGVKYTK